VGAITYINFGSNNGGILSNISEGGLCFRSVGPVQQARLRVWFSMEGRRIEADVELAWTDETQRTGGLRFNSVSPELQQTLDSIRKCTLLPTAARKSIQARAPSRSQLHRSSVPDGYASPQEFPPERKAAQMGFFPGLCTGLLIAVLVAASVLLHVYRRQFGESLVLWGERFGAKPPAQIVSSQPALIPFPNPERPSGPLTGAVKSKEATLEPSAATAVSRIFSKISSPKAIVRLNSISVSNELGKLPQLEPANRPSIDVQIPQLQVTNNSPSQPLAASVRPAQPTAPNRGARNGRGLAPPYTNSAAGEYLDVGKVREGLRTNQAMDELGQLGFHAIIVPSRVLWMNSYHILVGPYNNPDELEAVRHSLESRGFNPRVLQTKSRRFSLPPMTLYGTDVTVKDCIVSWELNSPDATIEFVQGINVVATTKAKWKQHDFSFKTDAVVSLEDEHGPATLLEIQRAGMDRGLVLDGSALQFYLARR
jgi:hypothetical protein